MIFQLVIANPRSEVIKKLEKSKFIESLGEEWIYLTVGEAVGACNFMLHTYKQNHAGVAFSAQDCNVWSVLEGSINHRRERKPQPQMQVSPLTDVAKFSLIEKKNVKKMNRASTIYLERKSLKKSFPV